MDKIIRPALKSESRELAELFDYVARGNNDFGLDYYIWSKQVVKNQSPFDVGSKVIASEKDNYSYRNMRVVECEGKIAGLALSLVIQKKTAEEIKKIPPLFSAFNALRQTVIGSFYLDSLTVSPQFRGLGLGKMLVEDTIEKAKAVGNKKICLLVFEKNKLAVGLYEKLGFKKIADAVPPNHHAMPYSGNVCLYSRDI